MSDRVHVFGGRNCFILIGVTHVPAGSPRVQGQSGRIHEDDSKRANVYWRGIAVRLGSREQESRALSFGHTGRVFFNKWVWRVRWRRLRHPIASRRPVQPMGVVNNGESGSIPVSPRGDETFFAIRRTDGGQIMGEFTWMSCDGLHDWTVAEDAWRDGDDVEFEIVRMTVESLATRTPPDLHTKADGECEYCGEVWPCEWVREHGVDA